MSKTKSVWIGTSFPNRLSKGDALWLTCSHVQKWPANRNDFLLIVVLSTLVIHYICRVFITSNLIQHGEIGRKRSPWGSPRISGAAPGASTWVLIPPSTTTFTFLFRSSGMINDVAIRLLQSEYMKLIIDFINIQFKFDRFVCRKWRQHNISSTHWRSKLIFLSYQIFVPWFAYDSST